MTHAEIYLCSKRVGTLKKLKNTDEHRYRFSYLDEYQGPPVSLAMPTRQRVYLYKKFPPFFEGLLPEGPQFEALLRTQKLDRNDHLDQLITVGADLVGAVTVKAGL